MIPSLHIVILIYVSQWSARLSRLMTSCLHPALSSSEFGKVSILDVYLKLIIMVIIESARGREKSSQSGFPRVTIGYR